MMWLGNVCRARWALFFALPLLMLGMSRSALAEVRLDGDWSQDRPVTLDVSGASRAHAIELLANAAGWSVVLQSPLPDPVDVHVKDQPASQVLSLLLPEGDYVAKRSGTLVSIKLAAVAPRAPLAPPAAAPPVAPVRADERGADHTVFGQSLTIQKSDVVHDVTVFGGQVEVFGTVTGDLTVFGGSSRVHDGAKVHGSATVVGGQLKIDDGAVVDHDVGVVGGYLDRGEHSKVGGSIEDDDKAEGDDRAAPSAPAPSATEHEHRDRHKHALRTWSEEAGGTLSAAALLFVFGSVAIALGTERSRALRVEIAARPMRTFALGVVGIICALAVFVALCVTIIGIPVALVGAVAFVVASYVGVSAALTTAGEALLRHRTTSPYVHLAGGCTLYFVLKLLPWVGTWVTVIVALLGVGVVIATRAAGLVPGRRRLDGFGVTGDALR